MKNALTYNVALGCIITLFSYSVTAQQSATRNSMDPESFRTEKRMEHYLELKKLGYKDREIFEDLGNANFLSQNYDTAIFWYERLQEISNHHSLGESYQKRYDHAMQQLGNSPGAHATREQDWLAMVKSDYQIHPKTQVNRPAQISGPKELALMGQDTPSFLDEQLLVENKYRALHGEGFDDQNGYKAPIAFTADGQTAYFSKAVYVKPMYGIFSKKELVHKIYKADKIDGVWKSIKEVALCPKNYSSLHPAVSNDGKRLFFASDMPGTYGKFDIYVANLKADGSFGVAKNLGEKVNTEKNHLYPNILDGNTLVFASEGHKGFGGLDVFMAQVRYQKRVGHSVNLGSPINSMEDDFSIFMTSEKGTGYVMSNRGNDNNEIQRVAFSYANAQHLKTEEGRDSKILEALNSNLQIDYTTSVFDNE